MADVLHDRGAHEEFDEVMRVFRSAVREAQEESRRLGVPNVYFIDGEIVYELPNGEYTRTPPPVAEPAGGNAPSNLDGRSGVYPAES